MKGIEINILYHNSETRQNRDMGVNFDWRELEVRPLYLVNFDAAHPTYNNDLEYTEIYIGGATVITLLEYKQFIELINQTKD
jgi:hypothetical protein